MRNIHHACFDEGWVLFNTHGDPVEWPECWPEEVDREFLESQGIEVVPC